MFASPRHHDAVHWSRSTGGTARSGAMASACVLGDLDLITPLGKAGVPVTAVCRAQDPARFSRWTGQWVEWVDHWREPERLVRRLIEWGRKQSQPPVLYYQTDGDLFLVSRYRQTLSETFRFVVPDATLVEDLADKQRFAALADRLGEQVPRSVTLDEDSVAPALRRLRFPLVIKPLTRAGLVAAGMQSKAVQVESRGQLESTWGALRGAGIGAALAQELVPGGEERIESYHAYIDATGSIAGEFSGAKIRTWPTAYGHSTAVRVTSIPDVLEAGRGLVERLALRGVVKIDYKRDPDGRLVLLEVNPRFTLWHHPGAAAGVDLPALVYADLTHGPRASTGPARDGVTWCHPWQDVRAARACGIPPTRWLHWALRCDTWHTVSFQDPWPFARGVVVRRLLNNRSWAGTERQGD